ncbi:MAG: KTSC domain-containing protein [Nitrososphaerota archaeon]|nr:KTSC domain-containing protein [Nitrososphaerota archaeon]
MRRGAQEGEEVSEDMYGNDDANQGWSGDEEDGWFMDQVGVPRKKDKDAQADQWPGQQQLFNDEAYAPGIGDWEYVGVGDSSTIAEIDYLPGVERGWNLRVRFWEKNKDDPYFNQETEYEYDSVPQGVIKNFISASSKGSYFYYNIRTTYPYRKISAKVSGAVFDEVESGVKEAIEDLVRSEAGVEADEVSIVLESEIGGEDWGDPREASLSGSASGQGNDGYYSGEWTVSQWDCVVNVETGAVVEFSGTDPQFVPYTRDDFYDGHVEAGAKAASDYDADPYEPDWDDVRDDEAAEDGKAEDRGKEAQFSAGDPVEAWEGGESLGEGVVVGTGSGTCVVRLDSGQEVRVGIGQLDKLSQIGRNLWRQYGWSPDAQKVVQGFRARDEAQMTWGEMAEASGLGVDQLEAAVAELEAEGLVEATDDGFWRMAGDERLAKAAQYYPGVDEAREAVVGFFDEYGPVESDVKELLDWCNEEGLNMGGEPGYDLLMEALQVLESEGFLVIEGDGASVRLARRASAQRLPIDSRGYPIEVGDTVVWIGFDALRMTFLGIDSESFDGIVKEIREDGMIGVEWLQAHPDDRYWYTPDELVKVDRGKQASSDDVERIKAQVMEAAPYIPFEFDAGEVASWACGPGALESDVERALAELVREGQLEESGGMYKAAQSDAGMLAEDLAEEREAVEDYASDAADADDPGVRDRLLEIRGDEEQHASELEELLTVMASVA